MTGRWGFGDTVMPLAQLPRLGCRQLLIPITVRMLLRNRRGIENSPAFAECTIYDFGFDVLQSFERDLPVLVCRTINTHGKETMPRKRENECFRRSREFRARKFGRDAYFGKFSEIVDE